MEAKLEAIVDRVIADLERFPNGGIYEIQNVVTMNCFLSQRICDCWELHYLSDSVGFLRLQAIWHQLTIENPQ